MVCWDGKIHYSAISFLFLNYHMVWFFCRGSVISFYLKIDENFMRHIPMEEYRFVQIIFGSRIKFLFLAPFQMDRLSCPSCPLFLLLHTNFVRKEMKPVSKTFSFNSKRQSIWAPLKVISLKSITLSYPYLLRIYAVLEGFFWDTSQLRHHTPPPVGFHNFKMRLLDLLKLEGKKSFTK